MLLFALLIPFTLTMLAFGLLIFHQSGYQGCSRSDGHGNDHPINLFVGLCFFRSTRCPLSLSRYLTLFQPHG